MPISEKILKQIMDLQQANQHEKELMLAILQIEDKGSFRYQADYEAQIKKYLEEQKEAIE